MSRRLILLASGALLAVLLTAAAAFLFVASGIYDISALTPHTRPVYHAIKQARDRAVMRWSQDVQVPPLGSADQVRRGMALLREHCVRCHGAPGVAPEPFALGLQPLATPLAHSGRTLKSNELYWVIRNGIKMTAMPAFDFRVNDASLWDIVAAVQELPKLSPAAYATFETDARVHADDASTGEVNVERGRLAVGQYGCTACHAIPGLEGPAARLGPALAGIGSRLTLAGILENSPLNMAVWLRDPQSVTPLTAMPNLRVTERDAHDIAAYLHTLK